MGYITTVSFVCLLGIAFMCGALFGRWHTKRIYKQILSILEEASKDKGK